MSDTCRADSDFALLSDASVSGWAPPPTVVSAILQADCAALMDQYSLGRQGGETGAEPTLVPRKWAIGVSAEAPCSQPLGVMSNGPRNGPLLASSARASCAPFLNQVLRGYRDNLRDKNGDNQFA